MAQALTRGEFAGSCSGSAGVRGVAKGEAGECRGQVVLALAGVQYGSVPSARTLELRKVHTGGGGDSEDKALLSWEDEVCMRFVSPRRLQVRPCSLASLFPCSLASLFLAHLLPSSPAHLLPSSRARTTAPLSSMLLLHAHTHRVSADAHVRAMHRYGARAWHASACKATGRARVRPRPRQS